MASWESVQKKDRIDLSSLWKLFADELTIPDEVHDIPLFSWEENMTVPTCTDCNMCMTSEFWFRFHLYTSRSINPTRILPDDVIKIWPVQADAGHEQDFANASTHWHKQAPLPSRYPTAEYSRTHDYFSAYIVYYLQLCFPHDAKRNTANMNVPQYNHMRKVFAKCAWLAMQITCLVCQYKLGAENNRLVVCVLFCSMVLFIETKKTLAQRRQVEPEPQEPAGRHRALLVLLWLDARLLPGPAEHAAAHAVCSVAPVLRRGLAGVRMVKNILERSTAVYRPKSGNALPCA